MTRKTNLVIDLPGADKKLKNDIYERITDFEKKYEKNLICNEGGWVPKVQKIDYIVAWAGGILITIWMAIEFI